MALKRRGMLLHITGLMSFHKHDEWRNRVLTSMEQEPTYNNESAPGIIDILNADKTIWHTIDKKCKLQAKSYHQDKSIDAHMTRTHRSHKINAMIGNPSPRSPQAQDTKHSIA